MAQHPPEHQGNIKPNNQQLAIKHGEAWDDSDKKGLAFFKEKGGKVITQSDEEAGKWEAAAAPVIDTYVKKASKKGLDGQAIVDFIKTKM